MGFDYCIETSGCNPLLPGPSAKWRNTRNFPIKLPFSVLLAVARMRPASHQPWHQRKRGISPLTWLSLADVFLKPNYRDARVRLARRCPLAKTRHRTTG